MINDQELQNLIKFKRYEQPEEGYFDSFLEEFHERQRSEILTGSARSLFIERLGAWFGQLGAIRWVAGAGLAYAAVTAVLLISNDSSSNNENSAMAVVPTPNISTVQVISAEDTIIPVSMLHSAPMDFSSRTQPVDSGDEQFF